MTKPSRALARAYLTWWHLWDRHWRPILAALAILAAALWLSLLADVVSAGTVRKVMFGK